MTDQKTSEPRTYSYEFTLFSDPVQGDPVIIEAQATCNPELGSEEEPVYEVTICDPETGSWVPGDTVYKEMHYWQTYRCGSYASLWKAAAAITYHVSRRRGWNVK